MRLMSIPKKHPFIFGVFITTMKTCSVDLAVRYYIEKKKQCRLEKKYDIWLFWYVLSRYVAILFIQ